MQIDGFAHETIKRQEILIIEKRKTGLEIEENVSLPPIRNGVERRRMDEINFRIHNAETCSWDGYGV